MIPPQGVAPKRMTGPPSPPPSPPPEPPIPPQPLPPPASPAPPPSPVMPLRGVLPPSLPPGSPGDSRSAPGGASPGGAFPGGDFHGLVDGLWLLQLSITDNVRATIYLRALADGAGWIEA